MSFQDDFKDLENRLRQNKPQTEPLPPAQKHQMRQALMEQMTMNENRFSFRKLSMALGGLVLLIGLPLFFWLSQMSVGTAVEPAASGPTDQPIQLNPTRVPAQVSGQEVEVPFVERETDKVWVISSDIAQGQTTDRYGTINVVLGYELMTVEEANLIVKLVDGPRGVLTVEQPVSGAEGTIEVALPLSELEEVSGDSVALQLNLILEDPNRNTERLLYLDFVEGWTIDLSVRQVVTAEITNISKPTLVELDGPVTQPVYEIELTAAYEVTGYDNAVLVFGYVYQGADGSASGATDITAIVPGRGEIPVKLLLDGALFDANGEVIDGVEFFVRINSYDEAVGEWLNIYPGNEPLTLTEQNLPFPYRRDVFYVQSSSWGEGQSGQLILNVTLGYNLLSEETADIQVDVTGLGEALLASESATIEQGEGTLTLALPLEPAQVEANGIVQITAVLTAGDVEIQDSQSAVYQNPSQTVEEAGLSEVWIVSTNVVTSTTVNGVKAEITLVVGYNLSSDYSGGRIDFANQSQAAGNSGGGGGGSSAQITPGSGTTEFVFGFETTSWAIAKEMLDGMSNTLKLFGYANTGAELLVGEATKIGTD